MGLGASSLAHLHDLFVCNGRCPLRPGPLTPAPAVRPPRLHFPTLHHPHITVETLVTSKSGPPHLLASHHTVERHTASRTHRQDSREIDTRRDPSPTIRLPDHDCGGVDATAEVRDFYLTLDSAWAGKVGTAKARYIQLCRNALLDAQCRIQAAHRKRMAAAAKLQQLGVPTIINPRSRAWLRSKLLQEQSDFRLRERQEGWLGRRHEDYPDECKRDIIRILRMHGALVYNCPCDNRGYLLAFNEGRVRLLLAQHGGSARGVVEPARAFLVDGVVEI